MSEPTSVSERGETGFGYQPALDGLRAAAVLAVIAYHGAYVWAGGGFLGVDAFFVLSGYLITSLLVREWRRTEGIALVAFWGRRVRRLLPALLLVVGFVAVYGWLVMPSTELGRLRGDGLSALLYLTNWRFIVSGASYFDLFTSPSPFRHLWSLAIEEQFYLVWPLVVLVCLRAGRGRLRVLAVVSVTGVVASVWLMNALYREGDPSRAYYGTDSRVHTLLVGCLLALLFMVWSPGSRRVRGAIEILGVAGALAMVVAWNRVSDLDPGYYGLGSLAYAVGIAAVIAAAVQPGRGPVRLALSWQPLRWIGTISYGLYLWHWPVDVWLTEQRLGFGGSLLNPVRLVVTFALATASYYLVELPIRQRRFRWQRGMALRWVAPGAVVLVGLTMIVSTAGATEPPTYLGVPASPCPELRRSELEAARRAYQRAPLPPRRGPGLRVAVVGDSIACSLKPGLRVVGAAQRFRVDDWSIIGCGVVAGELAGKAGEIPLSTERCDGLSRQSRRRALAANPDVVIWLSTWEKNDLRVGGRTLRAGTPRQERAVRRRTEAAIRSLTRRGARLVMVATAPPSEGQLGARRSVPTAEVEESFRHLDADLLRFVADHPQITLFDLGGVVCPGGPPCPREVDGLVARPIDGAHFSPEGSVWAVKAMEPAIVAAGEARIAAERGT